MPVEGTSSSTSYPAPDASLPLSSIAANFCLKNAYQGDSSCQDMHTVQGWTEVMSFESPWETQAHGHRCSRSLVSAALESVFIENLSPGESQKQQQVVFRDPF